MTAEPSTPTADREQALARDVMTTAVVSVTPETPVRDVARVLLEHRISAVPVLNSEGLPIGMVSEGDLIGRNEQDRNSRCDWWLAIIGGRQELDDSFTSRLRAPGGTARDVMSAPVVTVGEDTPAGEIACLLAIHHIKRVPVVRDEHVTGIVSRADLMRLLATARPAAEQPPPHPTRGFLAGLFGSYRLPAWETVAGNRPAEPASAPDVRGLAAADFRHLVEDFHNDELQHADEARRAAARRRHERVKALIDAHVTDDAWRELLHKAREAAEHGAKELMLLRFPSQLCIDSGRAINTAEDDWPATLRGMPAELYLRWGRELKPLGFALSARVLEFPDGKPGDVGLFLVWGE
jgi:CBS domain-containing protein